MGQFKNGLRHGKGNFHYSNGDIYDGDWKDDKPHGYGVFRYRVNEESQGNESAMKVNLKMVRWKACVF